MRRWGLTLGVLLGLTLFAGVSLHPYLAVTATVSNKVVVVEGWMPEAQIPDAVEEINERGYEMVYTTGTTRPFSYYLKVNERIEIELDGTHSGEIKLSAGGLPGAGFILVAGSDTILVQGVGPRSQRYHVHMKPNDKLVLISTNPAAPAEPMANLYVKYLLISGTNVHALQRSSSIVHADSSRSADTPTYAHYCAELLVAAGIPAERITIAPASGRTDSRTLANAAGFAVKAKEDGVTDVDVLSLGVHARRSRKMFRKACGPSINVGVIALHDPLAASDSWYRHGMGWTRVLKELGGVPFSSLFDAEKEHED